MTERLLRRSLGSPSYEPMRQALRDRALTPCAEAPGLVVRAAPLPLFQHAPGGGLRQVVRVAVSGPAARRVRVRLADPASGATVSEAEAAPGRPCDLLVPEVTAPRRLALTAGAASGEVLVTPQRKWTVYVVHHSHLDIGYTDPQGDVLRHHHAYLDAVLDLVEATDGWEDDARFRWNVEAALPLARWLAAAPAASQRRFAERARQGRVEVSALPFNLHTEACSTQELHRLLRHAVELRERYGVPVRSAMQTDVPGAVVGLVDALAGIGVRGLAVAHNWAGRSVPFLVGGQELGRPFWWRAPSGNRLLVWWTDTPHGMAYMEGNLLGLADGYALTADLLPAYLAALASRPYPYGAEAFGWSGLPAGVPLTKQPYPYDLLHLRVQGQHADNAPPSIVPAEVVRAWNRAWAWPRLRLAANHEFFDAAAERLGGQLQVHEGDWTDWWADGLGSGARPLGYARRAQAILRVAETAHALAGARSGEPGGVTAQVDAAYDLLGLFDEHTWGAANPWNDAEEGLDSGALQWARKAGFAHQAFDDAADLLQAGGRRLGATFARGRGALASFVVVNPSSWPRSDLVEAFLPASVVDPAAAVRVVDARDGAEVPLVLHPPEQAPFRPSGRRLELLVRDVPPLGYVRLDVVEGGPVPPAEDLGPAGTLENEHYRLTYDLRAGAVTSLIDRATGRELVNQGAAAAGLGQYVYERYTTAPGFNHLSGHVVAADLTLLGSRSLAGPAVPLRAERTAVGERLVVELHGDGVEWLRTTITLPAGLRRVDLTQRLAKTGRLDKESVFFAFPFDAGPSPAVAWELTGGAGGPAAPRVPGAARHVQAVRHWVAFEAPGLALAWATLEAPLVQVGALHLPYAPFPPSLEAAPPEPATVWSWAMNNVWDTNFPSRQQGEVTFRYAVASGAGVPARRLGAQAAAALTEPLVAVLATGGGPADPPAGSFVTVDHPDVHVEAAGRSRRGHDLVLHLRSLAPEPVEVTVRLPHLGVRRALAGAPLEVDLQEVPVRGGGVAVTLPAAGGLALAVDLAGGPGGSR